MYCITAVAGTVCIWYFRALTSLACLVLGIACLVCDDKSAFFDALDGIGKKGSIAIHPKKGHHRGIGRAM